MTPAASPDGAPLADFLRALGHPAVLVLGDVMLDRYVIGHAQRLSPEAPIPVLRPTLRRDTLGGAANVALNIAALGGRAILLGVVGDDTAGEELRRLVAARHADAAVLGGAIIDALVTVPGRPTTAKTRFVSGTHQLLRLDEEVADALEPPALAALLSALDASLEAAAIIVLSDYAKGVLSDAALPAIIARAGARAAGAATVIADPKRHDFAAYRGAAILTPNEAEARAATSHDPATDAGAEAAGRAALAATNGRAVIVTRSARGLSVISNDAPPLHLPTEAREVADVSGAGDTLVAALAVTLAAGASLADAAALANLTAGLSVAKTGTASVSREELLGALRLRDFAAIAGPGAEGKIHDGDDAVARVMAWRRAGLRVGFTNGCFDLLHPGHVRLLSEARRLCDRLVVALNSDASVRRLKGPTRPLQQETARATVMASMAAVDLVTLFGEDTPLRLIEALRPDVLIKGSDYTIAQVVGADVVLAYGGTVRLVDLEAGHSTSNIVRRMGAPA